MSIPKNPTKQNRFKWYHLYYLLAAFDVLTISTSLYLNHTVLGIYSASVEENSVWSNRVGQYSRLNELAAVVNAPGNDAFDSGDIVGERRRLAEAYQTFQNATTSAGDDLERNGKSEQSIGLLLRLSKIDAQVALIHKEATAVFVELENNRQESAGSRMAEMDRCFSRSLVLIGALCEEVRQIQSTRFDSETSRAHRLGNFEFALAGVVCLILCVVTWYGHKMADFMRRSETRSTDYKVQAISKSQMMIEFEMDGTITTANDNFLGAMGYSLEEVIGKHHSMFVEPELRESDEYREFWKKLNQGEYVSSELKHLGKDGKEVWIQASYNPILDLNGKPCKVVKYSVDITVQKLLNEEIRNTKNTIEAIVNTATDPIITISGYGLIKSFNPAAEQLFGYFESEILESNINLLMPSLYREEHDGGLERYLKTGKQNVIGVGREVVGQRKYGTTFPLHLSVSQVIVEDKDKDKDTLFTGIIRDLTEQKQQEAKLIRSQRDAEVANQSKSEFLANMSHEIRTPMTAILGFNDILLDNATEPEIIDAALTVKRNGEYLINLINDILDLSKIEAGKFEVEQLECSPHGIIADVASLMRVRAKAKGLPLNVQFDSPIPKTIQSDPTRLRQILINVVGNAIKFTETGSVEIITRLLNESGEESKLQFDVTDTGIGIAADKIDKLFKPFTQADGSTTRTFGGTGLGLSISKRLVGLLGGEFSVSSTLGKGSTFSVTVTTGPLEDVRLIQGTGAEVNAEVNDPLNNLRILLAEDGPANQRLIGFVLKKAGAEVTLADNGQIGFDFAIAAKEENQPFDVILMDMQMPVLDGYAATRRLREAGYSGPIIALTAHAMLSDRQKCLDAGCDDYTTKPIDRKKLIELVASYSKQVEEAAPAASRASNHGTITHQ